jgi:hypothetical protein
MSDGTVGVGEALVLLTRVYNEATENEWATIYARNTSAEFGARISEYGESEELKEFATSVETSANDVNIAITQLLEIERKLPKILQYYGHLSAIGDAWTMSIGTELLNRRCNISYYQ